MHLEAKLQRIHGENSSGTSQKSFADAKATSSGSSGQKPEDLMEAKGPAAKKMKSNASQEDRSFGSQIKYLNRYTNKVEVGTYMGVKDKKLKISIKKNNQQKFIFIDEDYICIDE